MRIKGLRTCPVPFGKAEKRSWALVFLFSLLHYNCFDKSWWRLYQSYRGSHFQCPSPCSPRNIGRTYMECGKEASWRSGNTLPERALNGGSGGMDSHSGFATTFRDPWTSYCPLWPSPCSLCREKTSSHNLTKSYKFLLRNSSLK